MAQTKDYEDMKYILDDLEKTCLICGEDQSYNIFWVEDRKFYVCKNCEHIVKGLYMDLVFQKSQDENLSIEEIVINDLGKMKELIKLRSKNKKQNNAL